MGIDPVSAGLDLAAKALETIGKCLDKVPDWKQRKKDDYFYYLTRYTNELKTDRRYRDDNLLLQYEDDLKNFLITFDKEIEG